MHSQEEIRKASELIGSLLSEWCLNSPADVFFEKLNKEFFVFGPDDYPRLRFNYVIANNAIVVIALNEYFQTAAPIFIDAFQEVFLKQSKQFHTMNVAIGDYVRTEKDITQFAHIFAPPQGTSIADVQINLHALIEIIQGIRLRGYIEAYQQSKNNDPIFGPIGKLSYLFAQHVFGDAAFNEPASKGPMLATLFGLSFADDLNGIISTLSKMK